MTPDGSDITDHIDHAAALDFLRRAIQTDSVTGNEFEFACLVGGELRDVADEVQLHTVEPGRPLVWSVTHGASAGPTIMLVAHLDTVAVSPPPPEWVGTERADGLAAAVVDGAVWGTGAADDKGGLATAIAALRTLRSADKRPRGTVVVLGLPDEESGRDPRLGRSIGMRAAVELIEDGTIPRPDFAIYLEPTDLAVYTGQIGFLVAHVTFDGNSAYFAYADQGDDPLPVVHGVLSELWRHNEELSKREHHPVLGAPRLLVWNVQAGGVIAVPKTAELDLIRIVLPSEKLEDAAAEIRAAVNRAAEDTGIDVRVTFPGGRDHPLGGLSTETDPNHPEIAALLAAMQRVMPDRARCSAAPWWSELSFLAALGIPGVYWAGGKICNCHTYKEHLVLADYRAAVEVLTLFLV